jgi:PAS domain S-box-containing protein
MATFKSATSRYNFISTKMFLVLMCACLLAISIFLWKAQESRNLSQLHSQTESAARSYSRETEIRYNYIYNALLRLANKGVPNVAKDAVEWENDAAFYIDSFIGIKSIAWVDKDFIIQIIAPLQENQSYLNQKANAVILSPSDVNLLVPAYEGTELQGFVLGTINIDTFLSPVISAIKNDYMLQLENEGKTIFFSENWKLPNEDYVYYQTITLQSTTVLNLSFAPTPELLNSEIANAQKTLLFSLIFSFITIIAVYYAQRYNALSRLNELRFRELLEDVELVAVILDVNGNITFCNDYLLALTGWRREEVLKQDWFAKFVPDDWEQVKKIFLDAFPDGNIPAHYENPILTRSGDQRWLLFNNTILRDTRGQIIGVSSLGQDITERKQAEEEIRKLNASLEKRVEERTRELREVQERLVRQEKMAVMGQMAGNVGHELRNPLGVISNAIYYLKLVHPDADEKTRQYFGIIEQETRSAEKIITDLLDFARIKSVEPEEVAIPNLAQRVLNRFPIPETITIDIDLPDNLPSVFADPRQIEQILSNLVINAYQAMPGGGKLTLSTIEKDGMLAIVVQDNGIGITPENMKRLFEPLFTTRTKGIGLGLAVSRSLAEANQGRIEVESQPGVGSTFYLYLPVHKQT